MKSLLAFLMLLMTIVIICSPLLMVWAGFTAVLPAWGRCALVVVGLVLCRLVKPLSVITGRDLHIV